jgi:hypothetical protein
MGHAQFMLSEQIRALRRPPGQLVDQGSGDDQVMLNEYYHLHFSQSWRWWNLAQTLGEDTRCLFQRG